MCERLGYRIVRGGSGAGSAGSPPGSPPAITVPITGRARPEPFDADRTALLEGFGITDQRSGEKPGERGQGRVW